MGLIPLEHKEQTAERVGLRAGPRAFRDVNSASSLNTVQHVRLIAPAVDPCFFLGTSPEISEAKELSTWTHCPASSREHFSCQLRKSFEGL